MANSMAPLVHRATDEVYLIDADWNLNLEICDVLTGAPEMIPETLALIRDRLKEKKPKTPLYAGVLLETCLKNVPRFAAEAGHKDFQAALLNLAQDQKMPASAKDKLLEIISSWGEIDPAFRETKKALQKKFIPLPPPKPVQLKATASPAPSSDGRLPALVPKTSLPSSPPVAASSASKPRQKFPELDPIRETAELLADMCRALDPRENVKNNELIQDLARTLNSHRPKLEKIIAKTDNDLIMSEALEVNELVHQAETMLERLGRGLPAVVPSPPQPRPPQQQPVSPPAPSAPLSKPSAGKQPALLALEEDDDFAQLARARHAAPPAVTSASLLPPPSAASAAAVMMQPVHAGPSHQPPKHVDDPLDLFSHLNVGAPRPAPTQPASGAFVDPLLAPYHPPTSVYPSVYSPAQQPPVVYNPAPPSSSGPAVPPPVYLPLAGTSPYPATALPTQPTQPPAAASPSPFAHLNPFAASPAKPQ